MYLGHSFLGYNIESVGILGYSIQRFFVETIVSLLVVQAVLFQYFFFIVYSIFVLLLAGFTD